ncbi:MAG TPA: GLUG motif-containing protein [Rhizomicrobium sp.]|nr:GLUG motif-containing protein [Rhizomicrobium sp.]
MKSSREQSRRGGGKPLRAMSCGIVLILAGSGTTQAAMTISSNATRNVTCTGGVCSATARNAVLNVTDLTNMLASSDVSVVAGRKAKDIDVAAPLGWTSAQRLTLDAYRAITAERPITVMGTSALTLTTNDGGKGGTLSFSEKGGVTFWDLSSNLVINGSTYTLVGDIATLASGIASNMSGNFALAANYNAKPDGTYKKAPVAEFAGSFEGLGNTISNLKIRVKSLPSGKRTSDAWNGEVGLFGVVDASAHIENLGLPNASVSAGDLMNAGPLAGELGGSVANCYAGGTSTTGNGIAGGAVYAGDAGGLIGVLIDPGAVTNSYSTATVTAGTSSFAGGLIGFVYNDGQVVNSYATGNVVVGDDSLGNNQGSVGGGLIGLIDVYTGSAVVENDFATGSVSAGSLTTVSGGLVGATGGAALIELSHASGAVSVGVGTNANSYSVAGGLVGYGYVINGAAETIRQSYATGNVAGAPLSFAAGLVGYTVGGSVTDSYAMGAVSASGSGPGFLGGLVGLQDGGAVVVTSYSTGSVEAVPNSYVGGAVGFLNGALASDYWDTDTSGIANPAGGCGNISDCSGLTGQSTAQFQSGLPAGFSSSDWAESATVNGGLPYLVALPPDGMRSRFGHLRP